ncbi:cytochrome c peroxidase [Erwinia sorbitola]|uniref:Cytochrome-c peroxidase n=1 Tax=Erwinia sorbitola TaxID=2681984 RepID=A0ABW9RBY9_9GAMM|nr:cytochrome c peroxidase [Erwinia sorbitola]MTD27548.1 cytochrome-c peroxidase [Erwinia sorbitola]
MFKKIAAGCVLVIVAAWLVSVAVVHRFDSDRVETVKGGKIEKILVANGCDYCHTPSAKLPFYANMPVSKQLMQNDIQTGMRHFDIRPTLAALQQNTAVPEADLAKMQVEIARNEMPPPLYKVMHWSGFMSEQDRTTLEQWIVGEREKYYTPPTTPEVIRGNIVLPLPYSLPTNPHKVALGEELFNDTRLSKDNTLSCASCHVLNNGGADGRITSWGVDAQRGPINAPTVFNSAFNLTQFWDGRAKDLQEQADGPVQNPVEMGSAWPQAIAKLNQDAPLKARFERVYPAGFTSLNITDAIAEFEKTLLTPGSPFDRYLSGDASALTAQQKRGYQSFIKYKCGTCHTGTNLGGQSFELMGLKADYFADRGQITNADFGRYNVTHIERDRFRFKTPTLRNISLTGPWFHDASATRLSDAVKIMLKYQVGVSLPDSDVSDLVALLESMKGVYTPTPLLNPASEASTGQH